MRKSGLVYFGRRYYDSSLGKWLTQDPLGLKAGPNLYAYVLNNPLTHVDLYGLIENGGRDEPSRGTDCTWALRSTVERAERAVYAEKVERAQASNRKAAENGARQGAARHYHELNTKGLYSDKLSRPFMRSPNTINEIMAAGESIPDPRKISGAFRWDVPGTFRGSEGTWELVIHLESNTIIHFNFVTGEL